MKQDKLKPMLFSVLKSYDAIRKNEADFSWRMDHADRAVDILFTILEEKKIFDKRRRFFLKSKPHLISFIEWSFPNNRQVLYLLSSFCLLLIKQWR